MDELERDCASQVEALETEKAMLEVSVSTKCTQVYMSASIDSASKYVLLSQELIAHTKTIHTCFMHAVCINYGRIVTVLEKADHLCKYTIWA